MLGLLRVMGLLRILGLAQLRGWRSLVALNAHGGESMLSLLKRFLVLRCDPGE
jgi:hypothetical protein